MSGDGAMLEWLRNYLRRKIKRIPANFRKSDWYERLAWFDLLKLTLWHWRTFDITQRARWAQILLPRIYRSLPSRERCPWHENVNAGTNENDWDVQASEQMACSRWRFQVAIRGTSHEYPSEKSRDILFLNLRSEQLADWIHETAGWRYFSLSAVCLEKWQRSIEQSEMGDCMLFTLSEKAARVLCSLHPLCGAN